MTACTQLVDVEEVAGWLATSTRHVQRLVNEKRIPYVKVGRFVRFDPIDVADWIENQKISAAGPTTGERPWLYRRVDRVGEQQFAPKTTGRQAPSNERQPVWVRHRTR